MRKLFVWCVVLALAMVVVGLAPPTRAFLESREPFRTAYQRAYRVLRRLRGPKHPVALPSEVGDGQSARRIVLQDPVGIGTNRDGDTFIADRCRFVWRIRPDGSARIIAGTGRMGPPHEGVDARESEYGCPEGLCVSPSGEIYFADSLNHVVMKIDRDGRVFRVAGNLVRGAGGDGQDARAAQLDQPYDVRLDSLGNLFIADFGNHRIRKVDSNGILSTVAGTGSPGYSGDGGPAVKAELNGPYGIFVGPDDELVIADSLNHVIRRVDRDGIIRTIAGVGESGYAGDGGPATKARLDTPQALFESVSGKLYIGDEHNHCVRVVDRSGTISTLIGIGTPGFSPDGSAAKESMLNDPEYIWEGRDGTVLIADADNGLVRTLSPGGSLGTFAGSVPPARGRPLVSGGVLAASALLACAACAAGAYAWSRKRRQAA